MDSSHNPADIGSRVCKADQLSSVWPSGPEWLLNPKDWPRHLRTIPNKKTEAEAKRAKEIFAAAVQGKTAAMTCLRGTPFGETSESVHESSNSS